MRHLPPSTGHPDPVTELLPNQTAALTALYAQRRELAAVLVRLRAARERLLPPPPSTWTGPARTAYDAAAFSLTQRVEASVSSARSALQRTDSAIGGLPRG